MTGKYFRTSFYMAVIYNNNLVLIQCWDLRLSNMWWFQWENDVIISPVIKSVYISSMAHYIHSVSQWNVCNIMAGQHS
jgi:hypothetical protein